MNRTATNTTDNSFFTRLASPFMTFRNPLAATGLGYLSYMVSYNLLQNADAETAWLAPNTAYVCYMGLGMLTANKFAPYQPITTFMNILGGAGIGVVLREFGIRYFPSYFVLDNLHWNAVNIGIMAVGTYYFIDIWRNNQSIKYYNTCSGVIYPAHSKYS